MNRRSFLGSIADRLLPHLSMDVTAAWMQADERGLTYGGVRPVRAWLWRVRVPVRAGEWIVERAS